MHKLLERQLKKIKKENAGEISVLSLLDVISVTYADHDRMRDIESRAMQLMSDELHAANEAIRRESEERISQTERRFEIAVSGTQDGIWDWSVAEDKVVFSRRALSMLGFTERDMSNSSIKGWLGLIDEDDFETAVNFIEQCKNGEERPVTTLKMKDRGGRTRHILCRAQGIIESNGKAGRVVGVHTDLTDIIAMQEELRRSRDKAEAANKAKSEFLANMTHELRTPLNSIVTLSRLVTETSDQTEREKFLEIVKVSSEMLLAVVNDILDFSKIEAQEMRLENIAFDLVSTVGKSLVPVRHQAASKGLQFGIAFENSGKIPFLMGDPLRLGQVLTNLATNAVKYTERGSVKVTVKVQSDEFAKTSDLSIEVMDTGIGIAADRQNDIFEKFTQADTSTTRRYGGTGLGLAISNSIIQLMGGRTSLESEVGKGSVFKVFLRLPYVDDLKSEHTAAYTDTPVSSFNLLKAEDARILVAEDHPMNQIVAEKILNKFGFKHITVAENGSKALKIWESQSFDLLLLDCFMPEMDGYEVATRIREAEKERGERIPIIAITANASAADKERCLAAGMDHYTAKPLVEDELARILGNYVTLPQKFTEAKFSGRSMKEGTLDLGVLKDYTNGDREIEKKLVSAYLAQTKINLDGLRQSLDQKNADLWRRAAHTLKGGSRSIGAYDLGNLAEKAQKDRELDESLFKEIEAEFAKVHEAIKKQLTF